MRTEELIATLFACSAALALPVILFLFLAFWRWMRYRETVYLAEKGLVRADLSDRRNGKDSLRWGIVIAALGFALCLGLYPLGFIEGGGFWPLGFGPWMLIGLLPTFFGLALVLTWVITQRESKREIELREKLALDTEADSTAEQK